MNLSLPLKHSQEYYEHLLDECPVLDELGLRRPLRVAPLSHNAFKGYDVAVDVLRADQLHPQISGNKWFKLKYNLMQAMQEGCREVLSFGGAWSNHLHALASVGAVLPLEVVGVVRGEEHDAATNPMLQEAAALGMRFQFVSRQRYRQFREDVAELEAPGRLVVPEGGDNALGVLGAASMLSASCSLAEYTHVVCAVGTGCTFAGLRLGLPESVSLLGVSALKGNWVHKAMVARMDELARQSNTVLGPWQISTNHHRGGFAVTDQSLLSFIAEFSDNTGIELEPLYTGKTMLALFDTIQQQLIPPGSRVLFIHSGGLQGTRGFEPHLEPEHPGE